MEPSPSESAAAPPHPHGLERKSPLGFFALLLALFLPSILAQAANPLLGLTWSELFGFLLPAAAAASGSNLRPARFLLLAQRPTAMQLALGVVAGGASFLVAGALLALTMLLVPEAWVKAFDVTKLFEGPLAERLAFATVASLLAPLCEEVAFRGYLQNTLLARAAPPRALATSAVLFAAMHMDPVRLAPLLALGFLFAWLAWRAGSLWPAVAAHAANNGIASALAVTGRADPTSQRVEASDALAALALGVVLLAPLLWAYRWAAPAPPPVEAAVALRDPGDVSLRFRMDRVPTGVLLAALAGAALLALIAVRYPIRQ